MYQDTKWPDVGLLTEVAAICLRGSIIKSTNIGRDQSAVFRKHLRKSIVRQLKMALLSHQYVFRLELPIYYTLLMQNIEAHHDFCCYIDGLFLSEGLFFLSKEVVKVAHRQELHQNVYLWLSLESFLDWDEEILMLNMLDEVALHEIELFDFSFFYDFHGISFVGGLLLDQNDTPEGSLAQVLEVLIVFGTSAFVCWRVCAFEYWAAFVEPVCLLTVWDLQRWMLHRFLLRLLYIAISNNFNAFFLLCVMFFLVLLLTARKRSHNSTPN